MSMTVEQKVGMFFLFALIMLGVMIELVEDWRPFEKQFDYVAYFDSSVGLRAGDPVRVAGVEVGKIRGIAIEDSRVKVDFYVDETAVVKKDSLAKIRQTNLLGGVFLGLGFGTPQSQVLPPGGVVITEESSNVDQLINNLDRNQERVLGSLGDMVQDSREPLTRVVERLDSVMDKIDSGEGTLGRLVNKPELFDELLALSTRMNRLLAKVESGEGTLGKLLTDSHLYENLSGTMDNLNAVSGRLNAGEGTLGRLLVEEDLYEELIITLNGLRDITEKVNNGQGTLGQLVNDDTLYQDLSEGIGRLNSIAAKIDNGDGTLGKLVNEDSLYRDAQATLHKVEKAVDGLSDTGPVSALGVVLGTLF